MANNIEKQLKEISERLEQGVKEIFTSERYTEYLNTMSKFHNYSFNNTLLITMQKPEATLVAGYQAWQKKFNRHVKRGEKGIQIIAPAPIREKQEIEKIDPVTKEPVIGDDGQPETEIVEMVIPRFRITTVFDVSQTEGEPIAELEVPELTGSVQFYDTFMQALQNISPVPIRMMNVEGEAKGYYHQTEKYIAIKEDMSNVQTMKTGVHEVSHALLHDREVMDAEGVLKDQTNMIKPYLHADGSTSSEIWIKDAFSPQIVLEVMEGLEGVVNNPEGTGYGACREDIRLAGKTGTAELKATKEDTSGTEIGWFTVFTTDRDTENPILLISMVENVKDIGGSGYVVEKDKAILDEYLGNE